MSAAVQPPLQEEMNVVQHELAALGQTSHVCSLHFESFKIERNFRVLLSENYRHVYEVEGLQSASDHPFVLRVQDAHTLKYMGAEEKPARIPYPVFAKHIAEDIVRVVSGGEPGGPELLLPAVWISKASKVPRSGDWGTWGSKQFEERFPEFAAECKAFKARQWRWCEVRVKGADTSHARGRHFDIGPQERNAAAFIGANNAEHPWMQVTSLGAVFPCPICGKATSSAHPKCGSCGEIINKPLYDRIKAEIAAGK